MVYSLMNNLKVKYSQPCEKKENKCFGVTSTIACEQGSLESMQ